MVREPETVNAQLRRYVAAGSASLTTIAREMARLAVAPVLSAHADGSLTNLDEPAVSRLRTAAGAVGFAVSAAPAAGCPDARAAAIQVGTIAVEILRVHAILLRDRRQPWAFGSDTLPYHLATPLQAAAKRIAVPSQAHAQAQLDRHQHEMLAAARNLGPLLAEIRSHAGSEGLEVSLVAAGHNYVEMCGGLLRQDEIRARWMAPAPDDVSTRDVDDACGTLELGPGAGLLEGLAAFDAALRPVLHDLPGTFGHGTHGPRLRWLAVCRSLSVLAIAEDRGRQSTLT